MDTLPSVAELEAADTEQPPWLERDKTKPVFDVYEKRHREMKQREAAHVKAIYDLRRQLEDVIAVCPLSAVVHVKSAIRIDIRVVEYLQENSNLYADLKTANEKLEAKLGEQPLHAAQSGIDSMNTIEELQQLLHLATEERAVFLQAIEGLDSENKVLRKKLEQCRDALQAKANGDDEASKLIARLTSDKKSAEAAVAGLTSQLAAAQEEASDWKLKYDAMAAERAALEEELQATKANLDDATTQLRDDAEAFSKRIQGLNDRAAQLRDTCDNQQAQLDAVREEVKEKEHEVNIAKKDCEDMIKVMQDWQRKVELYASQEKQLQREAQAARDEVEQARLMVSKAQSQEARMKRELAWIVERRQVETDEAIAHERAAVEDVRNRLSAAIASRDADISKLIDECKKLQWRVERSERESRDVMEELEAVSVRASTEQDRLQRELEAAVTALAAAQAAAEDARRSKEVAAAEFHVAQQQFLSEKRELQDAIEALQTSLAAVEAARREETSAWKARLGDVSSHLTRAIGREEDRLQELSKVRIEVGVAKQRAEAAEKRVKALQDQMQANMRRGVLMQ